MPVDIVCQGCGETFKVKPSYAKHGNPQYCSRECRALHKPQVTCEICGKIFTVFPSTHKLRRFCSRRCFLDYHGSRRITKICPICGKKFIQRPSEAKKYKTCSVECGHEFFSKTYRGEAHYAWEGKRREALCAVCGNQFMSIKDPRTGWSRFCSRTCKGKAHSKLVEGANNGRWTGGLSHEPYPIEFNNRLRKTIRERDGDQCQLCSINESPIDRQLDVHHIDYNKRNLSLANLISLCRSCNSRVNHNREWWTAHFTEVMRVHSPR